MNRVAPAGDGPGNLARARQRSPGQSFPAGPGPTMAAKWVARQSIIETKGGRLTDGCARERRQVSPGADMLRRTPWAAMGHEETYAILRALESSGLLCWDECTLNQAACFLIGILLTTILSGCSKLATQRRWTVALA
jgi:hypothetical protein